MSADALDRLLHTWMPQQRWYPAKGRGVSLHHVGRRRLADGDDAVVELHVVALDSGDRRDVVQVPLTFRPQPLEGGDPALLGEADVPGLGHRWVYDGPHDPAYVDALLESLTFADGRALTPGSRVSRVLGGEQSNTSIIVRGTLGGAAEGALGGITGGTQGDVTGGTEQPVIVKVFRTLHPGANPDVEVLGALADRDSRDVPGLVGWLPGSWLDAQGDEVEGHLAVATEFLEGSEDAWRQAVAAVDERRDFTEEARSLGKATAAVHLDLAEAFGTTEVDEHVRAHLVEALRDRVAWAMRSTDALVRYRPALEEYRQGLPALGDLPPLQRIHGDYHLGQVLRSPDRGWVLLDFEGEPLRPLHERTRPDLALRDVAGMLRSFDYAAGHARFAVGREGGAPAVEPGGTDEAQQWADAARDAFCDGYAAASGSDPRQQAELLAALELDKALYEVVYESRNRPEWIDVPLQAVDRLLLG